MEDKLRKLNITLPSWEAPIKEDDFLVAVGIKQSNSVYHVAESRPVTSKKNRTIKYYIKCYKTDLLTALRRDPDQKLFPVKWYSRKKKK